MVYFVRWQYCRQYLTISWFFCSCKKTCANPVATNESYSILLNLLTHPVNLIRGRVYQACCAVVKDSLGVGHVGEPASTASQGILFLLNDDILHQICCYGLTDSDKLVSFLFIQYAAVDLWYLHIRYYSNFIYIVLYISSYVQIPSSFDCFPCSCIVGNTYCSYYSVDVFDYPLPAVISLRLFFRKWQTFEIR